MQFSGLARLVLLGGIVASVAGCGGGIGSLNPFSRARAPQPAPAQTDQQRIDLDNYINLDAQERGARMATGVPDTAPRAKLGDLLRARDDGSLGGSVNRYLWNAALDVLSFLPVETVDPFSGVISTGYGRPPGGGRAYRATIYVSDPALDARSLNVAVQGQGGAAVAPETLRAIEDAILTRARQLRVRDSRY
ncbi:DUF3576 domain-containing protein [Ruixingdingia sedimenti]|uniref:DUF3576 domain-containing protein n=1 Tax=Ruixingdingia sedimenti TaxID=3073604 RepID=A0ABU1F688_9RHOB|nr:DUF3576 domain-containing protein [Xinfangfangia sp. LG-4]MDR5652395.1 DUF3576 domain-containing protein [Xinfangfangia sp. LG-4]